MKSIQIGMVFAMRGVIRELNSCPGGLHCVVHVNPRCKMIVVGQLQDDTIELLANMLHLNLQWKADACIELAMATLNTLERIAKSPMLAGS